MVALWSPSVIDDCSQQPSLYASESLATYSIALIHNTVLEALVFFKPPTYDDQLILGVCNPLKAKLQNRKLKCCCSINHFVLNVTPLCLCILDTLKKIFFQYFQATWFFCELFQVVLSLQKFFTNMFIEKNVYASRPVQPNPPYSKVICRFFKN